MSSSATVAELQRLIRRLQQERQTHQDAIAAIDSTFQSLGITPSPAPRRGRPGRPPKSAVAGAAASAPAAKVGGRKRRRRRRGTAPDGMTAEQFLIELVKAKQLSTSDINKKWTSSGRNGRADIMLGKLVAGGKLKREKVKGERGSMYAS